MRNSELREWMDQAADAERRRIRKAIAPALWELAAIRDRLSGALTRSELQLSINAIQSATRAPRRQAKRLAGKWV